MKHFCVSVYVFDRETKKFALLKHKKIGKWLQPGGHIEENEDPEQAAIREVKEETGLTVKLLGKRVPSDNHYILPLAIQKNNVSNVEEHIHIDIVYAAEIEKECDKTLKENLNESNGLKWFSLDEIIELETFEDVKFWCKKIVRDFFHN